MINTKENIYSKAYVELYEIIKRLPEQQLNNIPAKLIENIKQQRNSEYNWVYNDEKHVYEQDLMVETKALIVELYVNFLSSDDKKEIWKNYDRICLNFIENEKHNKFNSDNLFRTNNIFVKETNDKETTNIQKPESSTDIALIEYKESFFIKFKNFILRILHINK